VKSLIGEKTKSGCWPVDVDEFEASKVDAATEDRTKSESDVGAGSHHFLLNEGVRLSPTWHANCRCFVT
jgi:hypothetical protein